MSDASQDPSFYQAGEVGNVYNPISKQQPLPVKEITPSQFVSIEIRNEMVKLARAGVTPAECAAILNDRHSLTLTAGQVDRQLKEYLRSSYSQEDVDAVRALFRERFEALIRSRWSKALSGDDAAFDRIINAMKEEAKLLGLNMPVKAELNGKFENSITAVAEDILTSLSAKSIVESGITTPDEFIESILLSES